MAILPQIKHIVVVMLENRSFDNICGWLYKPGTPQPSQFLGADKTPQFNGNKSTHFNPVNESYFDGGSTQTYPVFDKANATNMPNPDPEEDFDNVNYQLFGPEAPSPNPKWPNLGFVINYAKVTGTDIPVQIMEPFSPEQVPVISALATNYAICDAWHASVPSNTWPNRCFFHSGTSNGNTVNGKIPNPFLWDARNIFNVLDDVQSSWKVYHDTVIVPSLTWLMFPNLWLKLGNFATFDAFKNDCASGNLPQYSFIEPSFLVNPNDEHPPHDVIAGEQFLYQIWQAVSTSPAWPQTLLMITYDEHGGIYDHVHPPYGAATPDEKSDPGEEGFTFNRFGVRVPLVLVSPWIQAGTVFRSPTTTPCDHTSLLATLRDWIGIPADKMLTSARVKAAPTLEHVLTLNQPRTVLPAIPAPAQEVQETSTFKPANPIQMSLVAAAAAQQGKDPEAVLSGIQTRQDAIAYFQANPRPGAPAPAS
jgi:phospholipase C